MFIVIGIIMILIGVFAFRQGSALSMLASLVNSSKASAFSGGWLIAAMLMILGGVLCCACKNGEKRSMVICALVSFVFASLVAYSINAGDMKIFSTISFMVSLIIIVWMIARKDGETKPADGVQLKQRIEPIKTWEYKLGNIQFDFDAYRVDAVKLMDKGDAVLARIKWVNSGNKEVRFSDKIFVTGYENGAEIRKHSDGFAFGFENINEFVPPGYTAESYYSFVPGGDKMTIIIRDAKNIITIPLKISMLDDYQE